MGVIGRLLGRPQKQEPNVGRAVNASGAQGGWGEEVACLYLVDKGWSVVERNARPCAADRRCEVDIIARNPSGGIVFVEVKTHKAHSQYATRLWRVGSRKKRPLLRACAWWVMSHRWHGDFRFDVIQVYGQRGAASAPEIDHIENVPLFGPNWRFWRGCAP